MHNHPGVATIVVAKLPLAQSELQSRAYLLWLAVLTFKLSEGLGGLLSTKQSEDFGPCTVFIYSPERVHGTFWRLRSKRKLRYYGYRAVTPRQALTFEKI